MVKKVQFVNSDEIEEERPFPRLVDSDKDGATSDFHNLLESINELNLAQINSNTDNLLTLLSVIPPEIADGQDDYFQTNTNSLASKMTSIELVVIGFLIISFFMMIFKHIRYDWLSPPKAEHPLTSSEILTLMVKNVKRLIESIFLK